MSRRDADIEGGEKKPLLGNLSARKRGVIEDMDSIGVENPNFKIALQLSVRGTILMFVIAAIIWVPYIRKPFPDDLQARIALVVCLYVFTINPIFGTAIANAFCGILGTFWACFHMWVMNGIFPGGMKEGMSPSSATAIFGWANMLIFLWLILWSKCGIGMKMFALATDIGFMLAFLDPKSTLVFSENFTISSSGTAVNVMLATLIACLIAPLMNLIPYPMTSAFTDMKSKSVKASKDTAKLFEAVVLYYCGTEASVVIESEIKHSNDLRAELDAMGGSIGAAWWEGFDIGKRGTIRALMDSHLVLLNDVYDRLRAMLIAVSTEDFGPSHCKIMDGIREESALVVETVRTLLIAVTEAAGDGDISSSEKDELLQHIAACKMAVKTLAKAYDSARRGFKPISTDTMGESFYVLTLSAYARLVWEYTEMMISNPPKGAGFVASVKAGTTSTWSGLFDKYNMNFAIKHFVALVICWLYSVYVDGFGGGCVITAVFLISPNVCPDIQVFLNVMNAVILAVIVGSLIFTWSCESGYGHIVLPIAAYLVWNIGLYGVFSKSPLALPALFIVALTPFKFVANCPEGGKIAAGARALWVGMVANVLAIIFVSMCQYFLAIDRASNLAVHSVDDAFTNLRKAFTAFWASENAKEPMGPVGGDLASGSGFNSGAKIEPRFWRDGWKGVLYEDVVTHVQQLRLDVLMLWFGLAGSDGQPDAIFQKLHNQPAFIDIQNDLNATLEDAHLLTIDILKHEGGHFAGLARLKTTTGIDQLEALPVLIDSLGKGGVAFPRQVADTMEDDELCQLGTVFLMLDATVKHIAALLETDIRNA